MKKILTMVCFAIMLTAAGISIHEVQAESVTDKQTPQTTQHEQLSLQRNFLTINSQLKRVSQAIQANNQDFEKIISDRKKAKTEVKQLEKEMNSLKKGLDKRKTVLKERARSYQQTVKHVAYLDLLLGATSLSNFVERVGAVAAIAEADQDLLKQLETQQQEFENKKRAWKKRLTDLATMKKKLETLKGNLKKQENDFEMLKEQHQKETSQTNITRSSKNDSEYIRTVINAGNKYVGNSVYVFGGGRNKYDVARGRFDCSGFVHWAFSQAGIEIGTSTSTIKDDGRQVSPQNIQPGDLVFFDTYKKDGHVGIYLGDGKFIGSQSSTGVAVADMTKGYWKNAFKGRVIRI
ncbi:C40 family peptidase [Bacillus sp. sid0103]|nr:C40 family peptidase [Bacillus sp. sid0103]